MNNETTLINQINDGEVFFFTGSGISYDSYMPSAGKILSKTAEVFLPQNDEYQKIKEKIIFNENNYLIQPEVFYENLLYLTNSINSLYFWNSLSPTYLKKYGFPIVPNINHLFIVDYSAKNNVPIFTTNFDILFEEASKKLGYEYKVVLPYTRDEKDVIDSFKNNKINKNIIYIFKLHGTIDSIETLHTTMTSISKVNFNIIDFLEELCNKKHIVFAGYSGRDIDYFPEIKKRTIKLKPFWINKFNKKDETYRNSEEIKAIRIEGKYPSKFFETIDNNIKIEQIRIEKNIDEQIFRDLKRDILNVIDWSKEDKILLLGLLCKEISEYETAYDMLLKLYLNHYSLLANDERKVILLITLSKLAHEISKYESCGLFARNALKITEKVPALDCYSIISLCQISESKRMLIAHDISFFYNFNYLYSFFAIISFIKNGIVIKRKIKRMKVSNVNNRNISTSCTFGIHESIEHNIRFIALLQAVAKPIIDQNIIFISNIFRNYFIKKWQKIRKDSFLEGYSHGIANSFKFQTRIDRNMDSLAEGMHIYDLTTAITGKGLAFRNMAEYYFERREYDRSKQLFLDFYVTGINSGNKLNAIKGLLGVVKCNRSLGITPILEQDDLMKLKDLMENIEGKNWQKYFLKILNEIE